MKLARITLLLALLISISSFSASGQVATFRWFEYCPGIEKTVMTKVRKGKKTMRVPKVEHVTCLTDSFLDVDLNERWSTLGEPDDANFTLSPNGLQLRPTYVNLANTHFSPSAIFIDPTEGAFIAATEVSFRPQARRDFAGMALYGNSESTIIFGRAIVNGHQAVMVRQRIDGRAETAYQPLQDYEISRPVWLRMKSYANEVSFFYSTNRGRTWTPIANNLPLPTSSEMLLGLYSTINPQ